MSFRAIIWTQVHLTLDDRPFPALPHASLSHELFCDKHTWTSPSLHNKMRISFVTLFRRCKCPAPSALVIWTKHSYSVVEAGVAVSWMLSLNIVRSGLTVIKTKCVEECALSELQVRKELVLGDEMPHQSFVSIYPSPQLRLLHLPECQCWQYAEICVASEDR